MIICAHLVQPNFQAFCISCGILLWLGWEWRTFSFFYPPSDFLFVALQKYVGLFAKPLLLGAIVLIGMKYEFEQTMKFTI